MQYLVGSLTKPAIVGLMIIGFLMATLIACTPPAPPSPTPNIPPADTPLPPTRIPSNTPTITMTPTSMPGPPILILPKDGALLPQPVPPDHWDFGWSGRSGPCTGRIEIEGPNNRHIYAEVDYVGSMRPSPTPAPNNPPISATFDYGLLQDAPNYRYTYTQDEYIPEEALAPWYWRAGIVCPLGSSWSEKRTFSVMSPP